MGVCVSFLKNYFSRSKVAVEASTSTEKKSTPTTKTTKTSTQNKKGGFTIAKSDEGIVVNRLCVSGLGLAIISAILHQDSAYWEVHITKPGGISIGVCPKNGSLTTSSLASWGVSDLQKGDVVGICFQQSYFPMLTFFVNQKPVEEKGIDKVKGEVAPAIYLQDNAEVEFHFTDLKYSPPPKCFPVIIARDMIGDGGF
eukprot:c7920_g1_i1.p1 GENE.c7920_g1_i1~~c7920_g1_i1.p1  ORF type:complete len:198 (-),score=80.46 c7920_g1_i1:47-640(-)